VSSQGVLVKLDAKSCEVIFSDLQDLAVLSRKVTFSAEIVGIHLPKTEWIKTISYSFWDRYICPGPKRETCARCFDPEQSKDLECWCSFRGACVSLRSSRERNKTRFRYGYFYGRWMCIDVGRQEMYTGDPNLIQSLPAGSLNQGFVQLPHSQVIQLWEKEVRNMIEIFTTRCPYAARLGQCNGSCRKRR
jgi:hypothetical protein